MKAACRCNSQGPERPCDQEMTQEDGLCDPCRANACVVAARVNDRWEEMDKRIEEALTADREVPATFSRNDFYEQMRKELRFAKRYGMGYYEPDQVDAVRRMMIDGSTS